MSGGHKPWCRCHQTDDKGTAFPCDCRRNKCCLRRFNEDSHIPRNGFIESAIVVDNLNGRMWIYDGDMIPTEISSQGGGGGGIPEAPTDGRLYGRKNASWAEVIATGGVTSVNGQTGVVTLNIPTQTSQLTNNSGFITISSVPTSTSQLINDSNFITPSDIPAIPTVVQATGTSTTNVMSQNAVTSQLNFKQDTLIAGANITIAGNVISASGGGGGDATWGSIAGDINDQADLKMKFDAIDATLGDIGSVLDLINGAVI